MSAVLDATHDRVPLSVLSDDDLRRVLAWDNSNVDRRQLLAAARNRYLGGVPILIAARALPRARS